MKLIYNRPVLFSVGCVAFFAALFVLALWLSTPSAQAAPVDGLFAEKSIDVDGVVVRRIRDPRTGSVCYLATGHGQSNYYGTLLSIACVEPQ